MNSQNFAWIWSLSAARAAASRGSVIGRQGCHIPLPHWGPMCRLGWHVMLNLNQDLDSHTHAGGMSCLGLGHIVNKGTQCTPIRFKRDTSQSPLLQDELSIAQEPLEHVLGSAAPWQELLRSAGTPHPG
jgi:hypothetical protein